MRFQDIPQLTRHPDYACDIPVDYFEDYFTRAVKDGLDPDPDFQRGYVWTPDQQTRFIEFILRGGQSGRDIYTNCANWMKGGRKNYVLVDGKQRIDAMLGFLRNTVPVFGNTFYRDFTDNLTIHHGFKWHVNNLDTRAEVLQWYLDLNSGGTVHTSDELGKVRKMLMAEGAKREGAKKR